MAPPQNDNLLTVQINALSDAITARAAAKVAPLGLDQRMITVLFAAAELDSPSQQQIAVHTGIDRTTVSKTIDWLEQDGLLRRHIDPRHRRRNWIELTTQAKRTLALVQEAFIECDTEFLAVLSQNERRQLARLVGKLENADPGRPAI